MNVLIGASLIVAVFATSVLSGMFGMAGGLIMLWVLLIVLPIGTAIAVHGVIQIVSNASRVFYSYRHVNLRVMSLIMVGVVIAAVLFFWLRYQPNLSVIMLVIGCISLLVWLPPRWLALDATRPSQAILCGLTSGSLTIGVGVSGTVVDMFFIRTGMERRSMVATKAAVQVVTHTIKVIFYWQTTLVLSGSEWLAVLVAAPFTIVGTRTGNRLLAHMNDTSFRFWAKLIISAIGVSFIVRGLLEVLPF